MEFDPKVRIQASGARFRRFLFDSETGTRMIRRRAVGCV